jgi:ATP-dependent Clp protease ATP-binding subunit ClpB
MSNRSWKGFGQLVRSLSSLCKSLGLKMFPERDRLNHTKNLKKRLEEAKHELEVAQRSGQYEKASQLRFGTIPELERQLPNENEAKNKELEDEGKLSGMLHDRVTSDDIARVVAKATGIPVTNLLKGERDKLVHVGNFD